MGFPVSTRSTDYLVTAADWNSDLAANLNDLNTRVNLAPQLTQQIVTTTTGTLAQTPTTTVLLLNPGSTATLHGAAIPTRAPWVMYVVNISGFSITLKHESLTELTPSLRFRLPNDTDRVLGLGFGLTFLYISVPVGSRWVAVVGA